MINHMHGESSDIIYYNNGGLDKSTIYYNDNIKSRQYKNYLRFLFKMSHLFYRYLQLRRNVASVVRNLLWRDTNLQDR